MKFYLFSLYLPENKHKMKKSKKPQEISPSTIIQSYSIIDYPRNIGIYGERLVLRLAQLAYEAVRSSNPDFDFCSGDTPTIDYDKVTLRKGCSIFPVKTPTKTYYEITIPAHDIMPYGDTTHYSILKDNLRGLMNVILERNSADERTFEYFHLINDIESDSRSIRMNIRSEVWSALLNFSKGYRYYDINKAFTLSSAYSMRLYLLVAGQKQAMTFTVDHLRTMFALGDKYKNTRHLLDNVFEKARQELDEKMPYSFTLSTTLKSTGKRGKPGIDSVTLTPVHIPSNECDDTLEKQLQHNISMFPFDTETRELLFKYYGFTYEEIQNNYDLFMKAAKHKELPALLCEVKPKATRAANTKGYVIQTLKNLTEEQEALL